MWGTGVAEKPAGQSSLWNKGASAALGPRGWVQRVGMLRTVGVAGLRHLRLPSQAGSRVMGKCLLTSSRQHMAKRTLHTPAILSAGSGLCSPFLAGSACPEALHLPWASRPATGMSRRSECTERVALGSTRQGKRSMQTQQGHLPWALRLLRQTSIETSTVTSLCCQPCWSLHRT